MNPSLPQKVVDRAFAKDAAVAIAEYGRDNVEFRSDVEAILTQEIIEACTEFRCYERAPMSGIQYVGFVDCSSGSGKDSAALAIAHREGTIAVLDAVREIRPPFNPHDAVAQFVEMLKSYRLSAVSGDKWATGFVAEAFKQHKTTYKPSDKTKSQIYSELIPLANSRRLNLLDNGRLTTQLCMLERRTTSGGRDSIDAPRDVPEDLANAASGALVLSLSARKAIVISDDLVRRTAALRPMHSTQYGRQPRCFFSGVRDEP
ncbi:MAG: hypothetical protein WBO09_02770 [Methylocystis silviterrae]|uniref:hypothetical protein n=1 Tax=Methylocystis silviterrae TaxID=2743612 RepID=UPI003C70C43E